MPVLLTVVLVASLLWEAASLWLLRRQAASAWRHRGRVPDGFATEVTLAEHRKAADYAVARSRLAAAGGLAGLAATLFWLLGGLDLLAGVLDGWMRPSVARDVALVAAMGVGSSLLGLPVGVYGALVLERRFGFGRMTPRLFVADRLRGAALAAAFGLPLLAALFWAMRHSGAWWLWAWAGTVALTLTAPALYTAVVAPLFNRFSPLDDPSLALRLQALLARCGFQAQALLTMDASRRSSHGNAFLVGFGRSRRIVLFDTLIARQTPEEIEAVVAHELGHFRHRHVAYGLLRGAGLTFAGFAALGWLCRQPWLAAAMGFAHHDEAPTLVAAWLLLGVVAPLSGLLSNAVSRRQEFQADDFARRQVGAAPMIAALTRLARDNAGTLTPDRLYALANHGHPSVPDRVARLRATVSQAT